MLQQLFKLKRGPVQGFTSASDVKESLKALEGNKLWRYMMNKHYDEIEALHGKATKPISEKDREDRNNDLTRLNVILDVIEMPDKIIKEAEQRESAQLKKKK